MTDTSNTGGRLDSAIQRARTALDGLRQDLAAKASEIGQEVNTKLDELQTAIDEIQASRNEATQLPADQPSPPPQ